MKALTAILFAVGLAACGDSANNSVYDASPNSPDAHAAPDAHGAIDGAPPIDAAPPDADCIANPVTSQQILNACTTAQRVSNTPATGCWYADGGLPPLP